MESPTALLSRSIFVLLPLHPSPSFPLYCSAPLDNSTPDVHYWVTDRSTLVDTARRLTQMGFTDTHFTAYVSNEQWVRSYSSVAPLHGDVVPRAIPTPSTDADA